MLRSYLLVAGVAVTTYLLSFTSGGCGGTESGSGGSGGGGNSGGAGAGGSKVHAEPPGPGPMKAPDGPASVTFAITKLYLGDTKRDGTPDPTNGWKEYGYDLDGKI